MNTKINQEDVNFHSLSMLDSRGRLFFYNQKLYRGVTGKVADLYQDLFTQGIIDKLINQRILVETSITDFQLDGYQLVLEHNIIPFVTYPHEWCDVMFKDATLLHLDLLIELNRQNLTSEDIFSLNILFDGSQATFVDFCSIVPMDENARSQSKAFDQFQSHFLNPLTIMGRNYARVARALMRDSYYVSSKQLKFEIEAFNSKETLTAKLARWKANTFFLLRQKTPGFVRPLVKKVFIKAQRKAEIQKQKSSVDFFKKLRSNVEAIALPSLKMHTGKCYDGFFASLEPSSEWTVKQENVYQILRQYQPNSCLDIDSNSGWYSQLAASCGSRVVAFDHDEACVRKLYLEAKSKNLYIVPLLIDFTSQLFNLNNECFVSIYERLNCDLVLAINLFFHVFFNRYITLEKALRRIVSLSNKWILIEYLPKEDIFDFIPPEDQYSKDYWLENHWYSLEEFVSLLQTKHHLKVTIISSYPESRQLLLCEKV